MTRAEDAKARLASVRADPPHVAAEGAPDDGSDEEPLESYAARRLQHAVFPKVELSESDLLHVYEPSDDTFLLIDALASERERFSARRPAVCMEVSAITRTSYCVSIWEVRVITLTASRLCGARLWQRGGDHVARADAWWSRGRRGAGHGALPLPRERHQPARPSRGPTDGAPERSH
jgi:hypothetical protein